MSPYRCYPLTDPTDGPKATVAVYAQWLESARPKVMVRGQPGEGAFVEFLADSDTVAGLRAVAEQIEAMIGARA